MVKKITAITKRFQAPAVAFALGVSVYMIRRAVRDGKLKAAKVGGVWLFEAGDVEAWVSRGGAAE